MVVTSVKKKMWRKARAEGKTEVGTEGRGVGSVAEVKWSSESESENEKMVRKVKK